MAVNLVKVSLALLCLSLVYAAPTSYSESISSGVQGVQFIALQPEEDVPAQCTPENMRVRKEWRALSKDERLSYLKAVQCLHDNPPLTGKYFEGVHSRYDDFVGLHMNATNGGIHNVGVFLPWHRLTLWTYENTLRNECNYTGTQPYWDYTLDTPEKGGHFISSPIWDSTYGFGSNSKSAIAPSTPSTPSELVSASAGPAASSPGTTATAATPAKSASKGSPKAAPRDNCVTDGPFAKYKIYLGPGNSMKSNPRCLTRQLNGPAAEAGAAGKPLAKLMAVETYDKFQVMDASPGGVGGFSGGFSPGIHGVGHMGIGGEMTNPWTSTNDPLFWMHHTELDRLWAIWQGSNATRLADLAAPASMNFMSLFGGKGGAKTSKTTMIWMGQFPPSLAVGKIADTQNRNGEGVLCYKYEG